MRVNIPIVPTRPWAMLAAPFSLPREVHTQTAVAVSAVRDTLRLLLPFQRTSYGEDTYSRGPAANTTISLAGLYRKSYANLRAGSRVTETTAALLILSPCRCDTDPTRPGHTLVNGPVGWTPMDATVYCLYKPCYKVGRCRGLRPR